MEAFKMAQKSKKEYFICIYERYHKASKRGKSIILDEFSKVCNYDRKYAIWKLNQPLPDNSNEIKKKYLREPIYEDSIISILESVWKTSDYPCSVRLKSLLSIWMPWIKKHYELNPNKEKELLSISPSTIDRRLKTKKLKIKKKLYGTTKPGNLLKYQIPIRTKNWDITKAGYEEIDTIAHCGNSLEGDFIWTINSTDIKTTWTERVAVMGKSEIAVFNGILDIKNNLPFKLRGIDSDNGSEFINYHLYRFCVKSKPKIEFTRSRPYEKEDQGTIEQKNYTHVRKIFGWDRYDTKQAQDAMNDLYYNELRLWNNLFIPSMKLIKKIRKGSKIIRKYDKPKTPFQRLLECSSEEIIEERLNELKNFFNTIDPFELSRVINEKLSQIYKIASFRISNKKGFECLKKQALKLNKTNKTTLSHIQIASKTNSFWRDWTFGKSKRLKTFMQKKIREYEINRV